MRELLRILATWRLTSLFVDERGPFDIFGKIRDLAGIKYDEYSRPCADTEIGKALLCPWCTSVWVGTVIARGNLIKGLAYSAGALLIGRLLKK
jgi:hypothetical protein